MKLGALAITVRYGNLTNHWTQTQGGGMSDITDTGHGKIWLAGQQQYNGTVWCSSDDGLTFRQDVGAAGIQNLTFRPFFYPAIFAAGYNGTLWKRSLTTSPCNP